MVHACCAYGCSRRFKTGSGVGFFRFPIDKSRRIQWMLAIRRKNFVPNKNARICGDHFITGKPSLDINHPDYVPSIFSAKLKNGITRKVLCEIEELPILNTNLYENLFHESNLSDNEEFFSDGELEEINNGQNVYPEFIPQVENSSLIKAETIKRILESVGAKNPSNMNDDEEINNGQNLYPEFIPQVENSSLINAETIKRILESDAAKNPSNMNAEPMNTGHHFSPRLFTFVDFTGKTIARFAEKRVRKNARHLKQQQPPAPLQYLTETVQVIIDKKRGKTVAVDRRAICISNTPDFCCKNKAKTKCLVNIPSSCSESLEAHIAQNCEPEEIKIKSEPESDLEMEYSEEDYVNYFSELKDFEQQHNFEIKIEDIAKVLAS